MSDRTMTNPEQRVLTFTFHDEPVRVLIAEDHPQLLASDVCRALALPTQNGAIAYHLAKVEPDQVRYEPRTAFYTSSGRPVPTVFLPAISRLAWRSRDVDKAIEFINWASDELLPGILSAMNPHFHQNGTAH